MMNRFTPILSVLLIALAAGVALAQAPQPKTPGLFPLEDLRPGMKGTARTVFSGSEAEEFGVEIPDDAAEKIGTVSDAIKYIDEHKG